MNLSPFLHQKLPLRSITDDESEDDNDDAEEKKECHEKTNLFGVNYLMWFEVEEE